MEVPRLSTLCLNKISPAQTIALLCRHLQNLDRIRRFLYEIPKLSSLSWEAFDRLTSSQKKELLHPYLQGREKIHRFSDIREGDHLVRKGSTMTGSLLFEHHFLCIGHNKGQPVIVHYFVSMKDAFWRMFDFRLGPGESFATVNIITLPHADFIKCEEDLQKQGEEVERVVWPDALRRYTDAATLTQRALSRMGEHRYHVTKNNCESFVMWCICGSNVSLKATTERRAAWETVTALTVPAWFQNQMLYALIRSDIAFRYEDTSYAPWDATIGLLLLFDDHIRSSSKMFKCYEELKKGVITKSDYIDQVSELLLLALFRTGGRVVG